MPLVRLAVSMDGENIKKKYKTLRDEILAQKKSSANEKLLRNIKRIRSIEEMMPLSCIMRRNHGIKVNVNEPLSMFLKWKDCNFSHTILSRIPFDSMKPVQMQVIPYILEEESVCVISETGSGKTLSFVLPYAQILSGTSILLVLVPTKELAKQVYKEFQKYMQGCILVTSDSAFERQRRDLQVAHVIVATIGRLVEHLSFRTIDPTRIEYLVVDEMDKILGDGFEEDFSFIWESISPKATQLFSATISPYVSNFGINTVITVGKANKINPKIALEFVEAGSKVDMIGRFLEQYRPKGSAMIVFCNQIKTCEFLEGKFQDLVALHGKKPDAHRKDVMQKISEGRIRYLVCTDVASRGIDFESVDLVVNYDFPKKIETFIHRAGRTGRSTGKGRCVSFLCKNDTEMYKELRLLALECNFELPAFVKNESPMLLK